MDVVCSPIIAAALAWASAQLIKTVLFAIKSKQFNPERIFGAGGMPSSHTAAVTTIAVLILRLRGFGSVEFALAALFAFIVIYDAMGVRRAAGQHAATLNKMKRIIAALGETIHSEPEPDQPPKPSDNPPRPSLPQEIDGLRQLKEFLGHTPVEVIAGLFIGVMFGLFYPVIIS